MFVVGIDGGGTKTRVAVCASDGTLLHRNARRFQPLRHRRGRLPPPRGEILTLCGDMRACGALCVGGAGASGAAMGRYCARSLLRTALPESSFSAATMRSRSQARCETPGCVLIAGTGSICYGKKRRRREFSRCGGGGHIIDDPGSGYALGRDALAAALQTEDGRLSNALHGAVMDTVGGSGIQGIFDFVYFSRRGKGDIAALAPLTCCDARRRGTQSVLIFSAAAPPSLPASFRRSWANSALKTARRALSRAGCSREDNVYRRAVCARSHRSAVRRPRSTTRSSARCSSRSPRYSEQKKPGSSETIGRAGFYAVSVQRLGVHTLGGELAGAWRRSWRGPRGTSCRTTIPRSCRRQRASTLRGACRRPSSAAGTPP